MKLYEYISAIKDKSIAVIGAGVSNAPLIEKLLNSGCNVTVRDRSIREKLESADHYESLGANLILGDTYLADLTEDIVFRTPGLSPNTPEIKAAKDRGAVITSEMEAFFEVCPCRILAVTGSDGKTTTTTIISELLKAAGKTVHLGGNIGTPLLCRADDMSPEDIVVLELSSFQLITMTKSPDIAVITNLAPNHLDYHSDMDEYIGAKKNIFLYQNSFGRLVLNRDNAFTAMLESEAECPVGWFSSKIAQAQGTYLDGSRIISAHGGELVDIIDISEIFLPGKHNVENYMAAFEAVHGIVSVDIMRKVAREFKGVEHRIEFVREFLGVKYYNDSIASSPSRTTAGLRSFKQKVILIAGGKDKGVPFDSLAPEIMEHVKLLVLTGAAAQKMREQITSAYCWDGSVPVIMEPDFERAVYAAKNAAAAGDIVILSPACTSFDRFKNFAERGIVFKDIVNGMN